MIRYKEKEFENYNIDPLTAVITDKNGVVQETGLHHGRPIFKGMAIHRIMAYTFYGYKEGYVVHHLDENKLNNALSNLAYLTNEEHNSLHHKGKKASEEARAKMSKYSWFTNDKINIKAIECPEGFRKGRCPWRKNRCVLV